MIVAIFSHYDPDDIFDAYALYYVEHLLQAVDQVVVVSTSSLSDSDTRYLERIGCVVIIRDNIGYDFYSYKIGIDSVNIKDFDALLLCNDSMYGPFYNLQNLIQDLSKKDVWGITDSYMKNYHIQSYFVGFGKSVLRSQEFKDYWQSVTIVDGRQKVIDYYEIGMSQYFSECGFHLVSNTSSQSLSNNLTLIRERSQSIKRSIKKLFNEGIPAQFWLKLSKLLTPRINASIHSWQELVENEGSPFIKRSLFDANEKRNRRNLDTLRFILNKHGKSFPIHLIQDHLRRIYKY